MIEERMEEQASLYVLGVLTPEETRVFEEALGRDAELQQFVATLRISLRCPGGPVTTGHAAARIEEKNSGTD